MLNGTHFVIYKCDSRYSITECSSSGVKQVFVEDGCVSGDAGVLLRLSRIKPEDISIECYIKNHAGQLIFECRADFSSLSKS